MDIARSETVEHELTRLIEKRARDGDPEAEHELWKASVRRHNARLRAENRAAWAMYHEAQAERLEETAAALAAEHRAEARRLRGEGGR